jgi:hypothetical protein
VAATLIGGLPAIAMVLTAGVMSGDSDNMLLSHGGEPRDHRPGRRTRAGQRRDVALAGPAAGQGRTRQRKPRCPVEVSSVWPWRAAGR